MHIIFHKRATKYRSLLRKMTYKEKGSYKSLPPCIGNRSNFFLDYSDSFAKGFYIVFFFFWKEPSQFGEPAYRCYPRTYMHTCVHTYVCMYVHTCMYAYLHTNVHTYINTYVYTHIRTYIHQYICIYTHTCMHTCVYAYMYIHAPSHIQTCKRTYIHTHMCTYMQNVLVV